MKNQIGIQLTKLRKSKSLRQKEVAAMLGIKVCTYAAYEEGRGTPSPNSLYLICVFYNIKFESFMAPECCQVN